MKKIDGNTVKAIRNRIRILFEHEEEDYYKPARMVIFGVTIMLNMKVTVIEINTTS